MLPAAAILTPPLPLLVTLIVPPSPLLVPAFALIDPLTPLITTPPLTVNCEPLVLKDKTTCPPFALLKGELSLMLPLTNRLPPDDSETCMPGAVKDPVERLKL